MNAIRTSSHIRTHRVLKGFHSCVNATGAQQILPDLGRVRLEECRRLNRASQFAAKRHGSLR
jgi:hypothetical protein